MLDKQKLKDLKKCLGTDMIGMKSVMNHIMRISHMAHLPEQSTSLSKSVASVAKSAKQSIMIGFINPKTTQTQIINIRLTTRQVESLAG
jgi:hypothetical protein